MTRYFLEFQKSSVLSYRSPSYHASTMTLNSMMLVIKLILNLLNAFSKLKSHLISLLDILFQSFDKLRAKLIAES